MEVEVYIDVVFAVNFVMDFVLLFFLGKMLKKPAVFRRIGAGAAIGGVFGCLEVFMWRLPSWVWLTASIGADIIMVWAAYRPGEWRERVKAGIGLYVLAVLAGGIMELLRGYTTADSHILKILRGQVPGILQGAVWLFLAGGTFFLLRGMWMFAGDIVRERKDRYPVTLWDNGVVIRTTGYLDTGNCLTEPRSGQGVQIVEERIWNMLGKSTGERTMIPYRTVGNPYGLMEGMRIEQMEVQGITINNPWIARAPFGLTRDGGYEVLLHGETTTIGQDKKGGITNGD